jgi:hypothetical protein
MNSEQIGRRIAAARHEAGLDLVLSEGRIHRLRELYALLYHPVELSADRTLTIRARWPAEPVVYEVPRGYSPSVMRRR